MIESTQLNLNVHVKYEILPADDDLPTQIDITAVYVLLGTNKANKSRKVNVLSALSESEIINLEDEIHDRVF